MKRLELTADHLRITSRDNPGQYHFWTSGDMISDARKVALAWGDDELLAEIDAMGDKPDKVVGTVNQDKPQNHIAKPRRGRPPRRLTNP